MYQHPKMQNVRIWDLPGIGSPAFKAETYLKDIQVDRYDFFIIVASDRFRENDIDFAKEIANRNKLFYFVRSKIDNVIRDAKEDDPDFSVEKVLDKVRADCEKYLKEIDNAKVFLISSRELEKHDFQRLTSTLELELPEHKKHALVLSLPVTSIESLERKVKIKKKRIILLAFASACCATVPIPFLSLACDISILLDFLEKCFHSFGLDDSSLQKLSERVNQPVDVLKSVMKSSYAKGVTKEVIIRGMTSLTVGAAMTVEYLVSTVPVIGSLAAGQMSYSLTYHLLKKGLDEISQDAKEVLKKAGLGND